MVGEENNLLVNMKRGYVVLIDNYLNAMMLIPERD